MNEVVYSLPIEEPQQIFFHWLNVLSFDSWPKQSTTPTVSFLKLESFCPASVTLIFFQLLKIVYDAVVFGFHLFLYVVLG